MNVRTWKRLVAWTSFGVMHVVEAVRHLHQKHFDLLDGHKLAVVAHPIQLGLQRSAFEQLQKSNMSVPQAFAPYGVLLTSSKSHAFLSWRFTS